MCAAIGGIAESAVASTGGLNGPHLLHGNEELALDVPELVYPLLLLQDNRLVVAVLLVELLDVPQKQLLLAQRLLYLPCERGVGLPHAGKFCLLLQLSHAVLLIQIADEFGDLLLLLD